LAVDDSGVFAGHFIRTKPRPAATDTVPAI
jgi:hypothetical protein